MIAATELRIGNILKRAGETVRVTGIGEYGISYETDDSKGSYKLDWFSPIPLTAEVLEKCGLEERYAKGEWSWHLNNRWPHDTEIRENENGYQYLGDPYPPIKSLHQLQNLYFALTGTELEIKL